MKYAKFQYWKSPQDGQYYFHLRAANGEIIAQSEGYRTRQACIEGIRAVSRACIDLYLNFARLESRMEDISAPDPT